MKFKYFIVGILIFLFCMLIFCLIGIYNKHSLNKEVGEINDLADVNDFIYACEDKFLLDCKEILKDKLKNKNIGKGNINIIGGN